MKSILDALEGSTCEQGPSFGRAEQLEAIVLLKREIDAAQVAVNAAQGSQTILSFPRAVSPRDTSRPSSPEAATAQHQEQHEDHQRQKGDDPQPR